MTGKSIDKPISPSNEDVLARMAEAESADLPHIKLKDEARGEVDHWRKKWEDLEMNRASCCMEMELENKQLTSKLERMERALEQISRTDVSEDWDVVWLVLWRNNAKAIARQALTDEVGG